jgi:hypothetical protein
MTSPSELRELFSWDGARVRIRDTFLDEAMTVPLEGTVCDVFPRPDWAQLAYVVMFDHDEKGPPGGEFTRDRLERLTA